jgi:hypothetical protein
VSRAHHLLKAAADCFRDRQHLVPFGERVLRRIDRLLDGSAVGLVQPGGQSLNQRPKR